MIPPLEPIGDEEHLPTGRWGCSLGEVEARFVDDPKWATSSTRRRLWEGFELWLATWLGAEDRLGLPESLILSIWMAGSFVSGKLDPDDLDISPVLDAEGLAEVDGRPGAGHLKRLVGHRTGVVDRYGVEPFPVLWRPVARILDAAGQTIDERNYLHERAKLDDLWQRVPPPKPRGAPSAADARPRRGYLEVTL